jgi:peptide/nickel transport system permease protein
MLAYILRRLIYMVPTLLLISIVSFIIIQLPPGDYLTAYVAGLQQQGEHAQEELLASLKKEYGLDRPMVMQYLVWMKKIILYGDFGRSFEWQRPVAEVIGQRMALTIIVSLASLVFTYVVAIPIGIYSATHQYSIGDYIATFIGFIGLATPGFLLALVLMFAAYGWFGVSIGGLFSPGFEDVPWTFARVWDLMKHMLVPTVVVGLAGTCSLIRVMRATLLDELKKQYVITARAKGLPRRRVLFKYPVRISINPIVSSVAFILPGIISGATIVSVVLNLPTTGPMILKALQTQDMYLAGSFILLTALLTVIGTLLSDILLAALDPRIRFEKRG